MEWHALRGGGKRPQFRNANLNLAAWLPSRLTAKKSAFTLAEVLITLGIIGVVAAVTLPTLVANYQKTVWVNQLKKTYSTLNEGFKRIAANEGCTTLGCAGLKNYYNDDETMDLDFTDERTKEKIVKEFKLENVFVGTPPSNSIYNYEIKNLYGDDKTSFQHFLDTDRGVVGTTPSGEIIGFRYSNIIVDINGLKSPNTQGRDIFWFIYQNYNGSVIVVPALSKFDVSGEDEAERIESVNVLCSGTSVGASFYGGISCAEKIIMDGWKMNY